MKKIFLVAVLFVSMNIQSFGQTKQEAAISKAVEKLRQAIIDGNKLELENIVSDRLNYGHSSGHIDDKKQFIEKLTSGKSDFVTINLSEQTISISDKVAIVRHKLNGKTKDGGKPGEVNLLVMLVWQKQGGKWILLARQAVKIV